MIKNEKEITEKILAIYRATDALNEALGDEFEVLLTEDQRKILGYALNVIENVHSVAAIVKPINA